MFLLYLPVILLAAAVFIVLFYAPVLLGLGRLTRIQRITPTTSKKQLKENPGQLELEYEEVEVLGEGMDVLKGWLMKSGNYNGRTVILLHGIQMSRYLFLPLAKTLCDRGFRVLMPDWRAHGDSGGKIMTYGKKEKKDLNAWLDWLEQKRGVKQVGLFGISLGGVIGLQTAPEQTRIRSLVIQSPYTSLEQMTRIGVRKLSPLAEKLYLKPLRLAVKLSIGVDIRDVDLVKAAKMTHQPVLFVAGENDAEVPVSETKIVYEAKIGDKEYLEIPKAGHNNMHKVAPELYWNTICDFFERTL